MGPLDVILPRELCLMIQDYAKDVHGEKLTWILKQLATKGLGFRCPWSHCVGPNGAGSSLVIDLYSQKLGEARVCITGYLDDPQCALASFHCRKGNPLRITAPIYLYTPDGCDSLFSWDDECRTNYKQLLAGFLDGLDDFFERREKKKRGVL